MQSVIHSRRNDLKSTGQRQESESYLELGEVVMRFVPFNPEIHCAVSLVESGPRVNEIHKWLRSNSNSFVDGEYKSDGKYKFWFTDPKEATFFMLRWS